MSENRSYRHWLKAIAEKNREYPGSVVIRHDVDYDIKAASRMLEIEREVGISSHVFLDIRNPNYDLKEIDALCVEFQDHSFGLHINMPAGLESWDDALILLEDDCKTVRSLFPMESCVAHLYPEQYEPKVDWWNTKDLEVYAHENFGLPSFTRTMNGKPRLTDGGGYLGCAPPQFLGCYPWTQFTFHPIYYRPEGDDLIFTKTLARREIHPDEAAIASAQSAIADRLTPYLATPLREQKHLAVAFEILSGLNKRLYRRHLRVVDAACGFGLLGAHLMRYGNMVYTGIDWEPGFIDRGREFFESLGYSPDLRVGDLYDNLPEGEVLVLVGCEDAPTDYRKVFKIARCYENVILSIVSKQYRDYGISIGKERPFIEPEHLECMFEDEFNLVEKVHGKRIVYHFERKEKA